MSGSASGTMSSPLAGARRSSLDMAMDNLNLDSLGELDITTEEVDFDEVDDDLEKFQADEIIKEALQKGVDLRNYAREIDGQLNGMEVR